MKLISLIPLQYPKMVTGRYGDDVTEAATHVGFDMDGRVWFLVNRYERLEGDVGHRLMRVTFARWQLGAAMPVVTEPAIDLTVESPRKKPGPVDPDDGDIDEGRDG